MRHGDHARCIAACVHMAFEALRNIDERMARAELPIASVEQQSSVALLVHRSVMLLYGCVAGRRWRESELPGMAVGGTFI